MNKIPLLALSIFLFICCNSPKNQEELNHIDSLISVVDSLHNELIVLNIDTINFQIDETSESLKVLRGYAPKTNRADYLKTLDYCGDVNKQLGKFMSKYQHFQKELSLSGEQLKSLRYDAENNLLKDSVLIKYLADEQKILTTLDLNLRANKHKLIEKQEFYKDVREEIMSLTDSIRSLDKNKIEIK